MLSQSIKNKYQNDRKGNARRKRKREEVLNGGSYDSQKQLLKSAYVYLQFFYYKNIIFNENLS